jgi:hypothetical protein
MANLLAGVHPEFFVGRGLSVRLYIIYHKYICNITLFATAFIYI